jgi:hypothetical protein
MMKVLAPNGMPVEIALTRELIADEVAVWLSDHEDAFQDSDLVEYIRSGVLKLEGTNG